MLLLYLVGFHKELQRLWCSLVENNKDDFFDYTEFLGEWFLESGQGMGATLQIASEKDAYTLTDRATYLFLMENLFSEILVDRESGNLYLFFYPGRPVV